MSKALLLLLSGPAGSGKTTVCDNMLAHFPNLNRVITATTRQPRKGEEDGVDYFFLTKDAFEAGIAQGDFYEHALVHGRHYGVLRREIDGKLNDGLDLLLNIDVQGAASFREAAKRNPELSERLVTVFIEPRDLDQIRERLRDRQSDDDAEIERRLKSAMAELPQAIHFQHRILSASKKADFEAVKTIYLNAKDA